MWISGDESKRDELIKHINDGLNVVNFKIGRDWQNYDPVIRHAGSRPSTYAQIASWASRQTDFGRAAARSDDRTLALERSWLRAAPTLPSGARAPRLESVSAL